MYPDNPHDNCHIWNPYDFPHYPWIAKVTFLITILITSSRWERDQIDLHLFVHISIFFICVSLFFLYFRFLQSNLHNQQLITTADESGRIWLVKKWTPYQHPSINLEIHSYISTFLYFFVPKFAISLILLISFSWCRNGFPISTTFSVILEIIMFFSSKNLNFFHFLFYFCCLLVSRVNYNSFEYIDILNQNFDIVLLFLTQDMFNMMTYDAVLPP